MAKINFGGVDENVVTREEFTLEKMFADDEPFLLDVHVLEEGMVMPMVPPGKGIHQIMITENEWYNG